MSSNPYDPLNFGIFPETKKIIPITTSNKELESFLKIPNKFKALCASIYFKYNKEIPMKIIYNLIYEESRWEEKATNKNRNGTYDSSLAQLNSGYFEYFKKNFNNNKTFSIKNPKHSLSVGFAYLYSLYKMFDKDWRKALSAYNAGATRVKQNRIPKVTTKYVNRIME